jgi:hypothetical protein
MFRMAWSRLILVVPTPAPGAGGEDSDDDWLNATEEEMAAEDAMWDATFASPESQAWLEKMADEAKRARPWDVRERARRAYRGWRNESSRKPLTARALQHTSTPS